MFDKTRKPFAADWLGELLTSIEDRSIDGVHVTRKLLAYWCDSCPKSVANWMGGRTHPDVQILATFMKRAPLAVSALALDRLHAMRPSVQTRQHPLSELSDVASASAVFVSEIADAAKDGSFCDGDRARISIAGVALISQTEEALDASARATRFAVA